MGLSRRISIQTVEKKTENTLSMFNGVTGKNVCVCLNWFRLKVHKIFIYFYDVEPEMPCNNNTRRSLFGGDHQATAQRSSMLLVS